MENEGTLTVNADLTAVNVVTAAIMAAVVADLTAVAAVTTHGLDGSD